MVPGVRSSIGSFMASLIVLFVACGESSTPTDGSASAFRAIGPDENVGPKESGNGDLACDRRLSPDESLQNAVSEADPGIHICLPEGTWEGGFKIDKSLTISGTSESYVKSRSEGSNIRIEADDVHLTNFQILGSGRRYQKQDAGVFVLESKNVEIHRLEMQDVLFGISAQKSNRLRITGNDIRCRTQRALGMRGDSIRFWEVRGSLVRGNRARKCRDMVVWYSPENAIVRNTFTEGRYGIHFMYSSRNLVRQNRLTYNVVGTFVMYSRNIALDYNLFGGSGGSGGIGVGLKESGNLEITRNMFIDNTQGTYIDGSPLQRPDDILYALNQFRLNNKGVVFLNSPHDIRFRQNVFKDNQQPIEVQGNGRAIGIPWERNFFAGYEGYDWDGDGVGDVPHVYRSLTGNLLGDFPPLRIFAGMPALALIETVSQISPMMTPEPLLKDKHPLVGVPDDMVTDSTYRNIREKYGVVTFDRKGAFPVVVTSGDTRQAGGY
jgi:nitrous oxidase accessory protein